jgi:hypothetical protein
MDEVIKWIDAAVEMPDDSIDVLVFGRECLDDLNTLVWTGYWDSLDECWRCNNGSELNAITHWAEMPEGPEVTA